MPASLQLMLSASTAVSIGSGALREQTLLSCIVYPLLALLLGTGGEHLGSLDCNLAKLQEHDK